MHEYWYGYMMLTPLVIVATDNKQKPNKKSSSSSSSNPSKTAIAASEPAAEDDDHEPATNEFGEDMLQVALRIATEMTNEAPAMDLETSIAPVPVNMGKL